MTTSPADLVGRRVEIVLDRDPRTTRTGRLMSLEQREQRARLEDDRGVVVAYAPVLDVQPADRCGVEYTGEHWPPLPCEKGPGHDRGHCDRFGRTW